MLVIYENQKYILDKRILLHTIIPGKFFNLDLRISQQYMIILKQRTSIIQLLKNSLLTLNSTE